MKKTPGFILFIIILLAVLYLLVYQSGKAYERAECMGTYQIDVENSDFNGHFTDSNLFSNLKLQVNADNTFSFSGSVPFIFDKEGTWTTLDIDGEYIYCVLKYQHAGFEEQFLCKEYTLSKEKPIPKDKHLSIKQLKMKKIDW
jgi:hypothetical protein